jgi:hypothetical protein
VLARRRVVPARVLVERLPVVVRRVDPPARDPAARRVPLDVDRDRVVVRRAPVLRVVRLPVEERPADERRRVPARPPLFIDPPFFCISCCSSIFLRSICSPNRVSVSLPASAAFGSISDSSSWMWCFTFSASTMNFALNSSALP